MRLYDVANYLETTVKDLTNILDDIRNYYSRFYIKKGNKNRIIYAPHDELKKIQNNILHKIIYKFRPHENCFGFVKNKSTLDNAKYHFGAKYLLCIDLKDFFDNIKADKVYPAFRYLIYNTPLRDNYISGPTAQGFKHVSTILGHLCMFNNHLIQGAPTSPSLSNVIFYPTDVELTELATQNNVLYSRYADDIIFSSKDEFNMKELYNDVNKILSKNNYIINKKKTKFLTNKKCLSVTGITINEKININRKYYRKLKSEIFNLRNSTIDKNLYEKYVGKLQWVKFVAPQKWMKIQKIFSTISVENN